MLRYLNKVNLEEVISNTFAFCFVWFCFYLVLKGIFFPVLLYLMDEGIIY
jgi:hypothetical protein